ncbi:MAG: hypothetical protein JSV56_02555 [Methanomassiliicoccales archaeon]|nr:MAG: hypothetical protein JSV56_02555 [Methanomassiliicoccales archaeon]
MKNCKVHTKKLLASVVNAALVFSILFMLIPMLMPTAEAATHIIWGDWNVVGTESYKDDIFILYGNLIIGDSDTLEFDNCTLEMAYAGNVSGNTIHVEENGTLNLLNNSLITTNSTSPEPYEFIIEGAA